MADRYGRPDDAPDPNDPLLLAARYNDAEMQDVDDFEAFHERHGLNHKTVIYVAEQRAMRYAILRTEGMAGLNKLRGTNMAQVFRPSEAQRALMDLVLPTYIDAIVIGWRAHELSD